MDIVHKRLEVWHLLYWQQYDDQDPGSSASIVQRTRLGVQRSSYQRRPYRDAASALWVANLQSVRRRKEQQPESPIPFDFSSLTNSATRTCQWRALTQIQYQ